ncbi:MAG: efflux RND transporter periplasmic adaptor subunit [Pseudomonadota bacterium]
MNRKILVVAISLALLAGAGWYVLQAQQGGAPAELLTPPTPAKPAATEPKVLYWYDPMRPEVHFDKPGPSPFMDMALVPKYAEAGASAEAGEKLPAITVDARMVQSLGMRTAPVEKGTFWQRIDTTGTVAFDESRTQVVEARASGWVRKLQVRSVDAPVRAGETLLTLYSPDLLAAQNELLIAQRSGDETLLAATRERVSLLGVSAAQIRTVLASGKAAPDVVIAAPATGVLTELNVREGSQVTPGMPVARIAALDRVWVLVEVPEAQAGWLRGERPAEVQVPALPDKTFEANVDYLYPQIDAARRTLRARLVIDNRDLLLRPGMSASVTLFGGPRHDVLLVPDEAVVRSGQRDLVIVAEGGGRFRPVPVKVGAQRHGQTVIDSGLEEGTQVVVSGQFLLESEANLQGALQRLAPAESDSMQGHGDTP